MPKIEQYIRARAKKGVAGEALKQCAWLAQRLPGDPREVSRSDIEGLLAADWCFGCRRVAFHYLCLALVDLKVWPREFLPWDVSRGLVKKALSPEWRGFLERFSARLLAGGTAKDCWHSWLKRATMFVWWHGLPAGRPFDGEMLKESWRRFGAEMSRKRRPDTETSNRHARGFALFWNHAIEEGLLTGERMPEERVATSFWSPLQEPLRVELHRRYPLVRGAAGPREAYFHLLRYALYLLGYSKRAVPRAGREEEAEFVRLKTTLLGERFGAAGVAEAIAEAKELLAALGGGQ